MGVEGRISRRRALELAARAGAGAAVAGALPAAAEAQAGTTQIVMLIRHAEKPTVKKHHTPKPPFGVTASGTEDA